MPRPNRSPPSPLVRDEYTARHLPLLRFVAAIDALRRRAWGPDLTDSAIMIEVWLAYLDQQPWNRAGLAQQLGVSLGTLRNHVARLVGRGWLIEQRDPRQRNKQYIILPTEAAKEHVKAADSETLIVSLLAAAQALQAALAKLAT